MFDGIYLQPPSDDEMAAAEINTGSDTAQNSECNSGLPSRRQPRVCQSNDKMKGSRRFYACAKCQCLLDNRAQYINHAEKCYGKVRSRLADELVGTKVIEFDDDPELGTCYVCKTFRQLKYSVLVTHEFICEKRDWYGEHGDPPYIPPLSEWIRVGGKLVPPPEFLEVMKHFEAVGNWPAHEREYLEQYNKWFLNPVADEIVITKPGPRTRAMTRDAAPGGDRTGKTKVLESDLFVPIAKVQPQRHAPVKPNNSAGVASLTNKTGMIYDVKKRAYIGHMLVEGCPPPGWGEMRNTIEPYRVFRFYYSCNLDSTDTLEHRVKSSVVVSLIDINTGLPFGALHFSADVKNWTREMFIHMSPSHSNFYQSVIRVEFVSMPVELQGMFTCKKQRKSVK